MSDQRRQFDPTGPLERLRGDESLLKDMIGFFVADYEPLLETANKELDAGNLAEVQRAAHTLKGLASTFDATATIAAAREVEEAAQRRRINELPELVGQLQRSADALADELTSYCQTQA